MTDSVYLRNHYFHMCKDLFLFSHFFHHHFPVITFTHEEIIIIRFFATVKFSPLLCFILCVKIFSCFHHHFLVSTCTNEEETIIIRYSYRAYLPNHYFHMGKHLFLFSEYFYHHCPNFHSRGNDYYGYRLYAIIMFICPIIFESTVI